MGHLTRTFRTLKGTHNKSEVVTVYGTLCVIPFRNSNRVHLYINRIKAMKTFISFSVMSCSSGLLDAYWL
jgi:hypothetical protein